MTGFITDQQAAQTCSLAGLATMKGKMVKLQQLQAALVQHMREAEEAKDHSNVVRYALFGLRIVKASCDAAIGITGAALEGPFGKLSAAYSGATPFAENIGKTIAGEKVGAAGWVKAANSAGSAMLEKSGLDGVAKGAAELQFIKSDIVVDAFAQNEEDLLKDTARYAEKIALISAEALKKKGLVKFYSISKEVVLVADSYASAYKELKSNDMSATLDASVRGFKLSLARLDRQLVLLGAEISRCDAQLRAQGALTAPVSAADHLFESPARAMFSLP